MAWNNFEQQTALERDVLRRALPLVSAGRQASATATVDLAHDTAHVGITAVDVIGASPESCVELLGLRPLLTGAAWKVIDQLLEEALEQAGLVPDQPRGWSIARKVAHAKNKLARPAGISTDACGALLTTYVATIDIRHSLVHRRAHTDPGHALIGVDEHGNALRPLTALEQEALARAALGAASLVTAPAPDSRDEAGLIHHLTGLSGVHGVPITGGQPPAVVPELTVIVDADANAPAQYVLDIPALKKRQPFQQNAFIDLIVSPRDQPGRDLRGRLEEAPDAVLRFDLDHPPGWLH